MAAIKAENRTLHYYFKKHISLLDRASTKKTFESVYRTKIVPYIPQEIKIKDVKASDIDNILEPLYNVYKTGTIEKVVTILAAVFNRCVKNKVIKSSPLRKRHLDIKADRLEQKTIIQNYDEHYAAVLKEISTGKYTPQQVVAVQFLLHGRRSNEIMTLKWSDINIKGLYYTVRAENSKINKVMKFHIGNALAAALVELREWYVWKPKDDDKIFYAIKGQNEGKPLTSISSLWNSVKRGKSFEHIRPHDFRRIIATKLINRGKNATHIMSILGHLSDTEYKQYMELDRVSITGEILEWL